MLLNGIKNRFELNIVNYEFPKAKNEKWDADWLNIKIKVKSSKGSWKATDSMLLTWEIDWLIKWLEDIFTNVEKEKELDFMEPSLKFVKIKETRNKAFIRIYFELEARPKWAESNIAGKEDLWVDVTPSLEELTKTIKNLKKQRKKYPTRVPMEKGIEIC